MKKTIYVAPEVELMECRVEKGFAGSLPESEGNAQGQNVDDDGDPEILFT